MNLSQNKKKGKFGEVHAAAYLRRQGYILLGRNYAYRGGAYSQPAPAPYRRFSCTASRPD